MVRAHRCWLAPGPHNLNRCQHRPFRRRRAGVLGIPCVVRHMRCECHRKCRTKVESSYSHQSRKFLF